MATTTDNEEKKPGVFKKFKNKLRPGKEKKEKIKKGKASKFPLAEEEPDRERNTTYDTDTDNEVQSINSAGKKEKKSISSKKSKNYSLDSIEDSVFDSKSIKSTKSKNSIKSILSSNFPFKSNNFCCLKHF